MPTALTVVLRALADLLGTGDPAAIEAVLDPDVEWVGTQPGLRCDGREAAMRIIGDRLLHRRLDLRAVELVDAGGDTVLVGLQGPGLNGVPGDTDTDGQLYNVLSVRDGRVVGWRSFADRAEALAAAGTDRHWS